ncbi:MAG: DoxX family membrane protein [Streptosporangiales bacterium]|nr:DoxX family membrane protein [Streptosporangiales bacterium]
MNASLVKSARDLVLLLARVGVGAVMIMHAKAEYDYGGSIAGVVAAFEESGVPLPVVTGPVNMFGELIGGVAMIIGLGVPLVGVLMALNMVGAWIFVHAGYGFFDPQGPGLVILLGLLSLVLAVSGSGRLGLDHLIFGRGRRGAKAELVS